MKKRKAALCLLIVWLLAGPVRASEALIPGGEIIGMELESRHVVVAAFDRDSPGEAAGLRIGDRIEKVGNCFIETGEDVTKALKNATGPVKVQVLRGNETLCFPITPEIREGVPRLGIYLKQGITGVGTVTYYDPENCTFGALGHGVWDKNNALLELSRGRILSASVQSVKKGRSGEPGQLMGTGNPADILGTLTKNTPQGVFGTVLHLPKTAPVEVADRDDVHTGDAVIRSTVEGSTPAEYSVQILKVYASQGNEGRNLLLKVTDPMLLSQTGGIVQGMSGSPILQDGKLIGAVTHVLVNDPTTGYGIFIENMLKAAG